MKKELNNTLPVLVYDEVDSKIFGIVEDQLSEIASKHATKIVNVSTSTIKSGIKHVLENLSSTLDDIQLEMNNYDIDEVEVNLNIGLGGEVSILSICSVDANIASSITIKMKRKNR